jgi:hypothetical protein
MTTQGLGDQGSFFDLCKAGDAGRVVNFLKALKDPRHIQQTLDDVDPIYRRTCLHIAVDNCH